MHLSNAFGGSLRTLLAYSGWSSHERASRRCSTDCEHLRKNWHVCGARGEEHAGECIEPADHEHGRELARCLVGLAERAPFADVASRRLAAPFADDHLWS